MKTFLSASIILLISTILAFGQEEPIPGIAAVDVHGNLTNKGFKLEKLTNDGQTLWICRSDEGDILYEASAYGPSTTKITSVRANVVDSTGRINSTAADFLGFIASLPYTGSKPAEAREWVVQNISRTTSTVIGGVKLEINARGPGARILTMTKE